jgi:2-polyprenyl-6-methoxyphenol hydroxylase-like FAD-dependent oxidoreductase
MSNRTVLISGAGIAGPTLAYWLKAAGFQPTLIERAPALRTGGYVIDFWGLGYDIAERMGLLRAINCVGYHVREMRVVDDRGRRITGFGTKVFEELTAGRYVTLARSDLSRLLFEKIHGAVDVIFDDEIVGLEQWADAVRRTRVRSSGRRRRSAFGGSRARFRAATALRKATRICRRGVRGPRLPPAR